MGQQQLLLLVLGIVIVGLAVVVGIATFTDARQQSDVDRYTSMGVDLAGEVIAYYMTPAAMGGGGEDPAKFGTFTIADLGYEQTFTDTHAGYSRTGTQSNGIRRDLMRHTTHPAIHITTYPLAAGDTRVEVYVFGPVSGCIVARSNTLGDPTWSDGNTDAVAPDNPNSDLCSW